MFHTYIRVSTYEQKTNTSPEDQERVCRAVAMAKGIGPMDVVTWRDLDVSGSVPLGDRPRGGRMLERVERGDVIVAAKLDRMFRDALDALQMAKEFKQRGIDLILFDMGIESVLHGTMSKAFFQIGAVFAEMERDRINERTRGGKLAKKNKGGHVGGEAPYGHSIVGQGRAATLVVCPEERALLDYVKSIQSQMDVSFVRRELHARGYRDRNGNPFRNIQVKRLMQRNLELAGVDHEERVA